MTVREGVGEGRCLSSLVTHELEVVKPHCVVIAPYASFEALNR
jgi:hypothetical protein